MTKILVAYHSTDGQTAKIAHRITSVLEESGAGVEMHDAADAPPPDGFDAIVVGDSIRSGRHSRDLTRYLQHHRDAFSEVPTALFQVSLTSANPDDAHAPRRTTWSSAWSTTPG